MIAYGGLCDHFNGEIKASREAEVDCCFVLRGRRIEPAIQSVLVVSVDVVEAGFLVNLWYSL